MNAASPRSGTVEANGTLFFAERCGHGTPLILIHGAGQDAGDLVELTTVLGTAGFEVLVYDRRGTGRSGRDRWPGGAACQHAEDAAALLELFKFTPAVAVGVDSGGIIALKLGALYPESVLCVVAWEPPASSVVRGAPEATQAILLPVTAYLAEYPHDYIGAQALLLSSLTCAAVDIDDPAFARERVNAEPMVRDEPAITLTTFGPEISRSRVNIVVSSQPGEFFGAAAAELARLARGQVHQVAGGHRIYQSDPTRFARLVTDIVHADRTAPAARQGHLPR